MLGILNGVSGDAAEHTDAIDRWIRVQVAKTPSAADLQDQWVKWYNGLGWLEKGYEDTAKEASNRRNAFTVAQQTTPEAVEQVKVQLAQGATREEYKGKPKETDAAGNYPTKPGITVASAAPGTVIPGARPVIKVGSRGDAVKAWQAIIGTKPEDGIFGNGTKAATIAWQKERGLTADGIVGSATWAAALSGSAPHMKLETAKVVPVAPVGVKPSAVKPGQVIPKVSVEKPKPTKPQAKPSVSAAVNQASVVPPIVSGNLWDKFKKLPPFGQGLIVAGLAIIGVNVHKAYKS